MEQSSNEMTLIKCSKCHISIPLIVLRHGHDDAIVEIVCSCITTTTLIEIKAQQHQHYTLKEYLAFMTKQKESKYIKSLSQSLSYINTNLSLSMKCNAHLHSCIQYCRICYYHCCENCIITHSRHILIDIPSIDYEKVYTATMEAIALKMQKHKDITDSLLSLLPLQDKLKAQMRQELLKQYALNYAINSRLKELYTAIYNTARTFLINQHSQPIYQLNYMFKVMKVKPCSLSFDKENTPLSTIVNIVKQYLKFNFIFKLNIYENKQTIHKPTYFNIIQLFNGLLASSSFDNSIQLWNLEHNFTMIQIADLVSHVDIINCLFGLSNGLLASGSNDGVIKLWSITTMTCSFSFKAHYYGVTCLTQLINDILVSGSHDADIKLWKLDSVPKCIAVFSSHELAVTCILALSNGLLASCSDDATIKLWNPDCQPKNASPLKTVFENEKYACVTCVIELSNGNLASSSFQNTIKFWNVDTMVCIKIIQAHYKIIWCLIELYDGLLASGGMDTTIKLWNITTGDCLTTLYGHSDNVTSIVQLDDGSLISGSDDSYIKVWKKC